MAPAPEHGHHAPHPGTAEAAWRRMFLAAAGTAGALLAVAYLFVALLDPWGGLPLSPTLPRVPVTSSARFAFPMLARDGRFDSAVIGSSTARLLRPEVLNPLFGASFVNLAFDAATAHESTRLLRVFLQSQAAPRYVLLGLDAAWCRAAPEVAYGVNQFPEWLYEQRGWRGYGEILNPFALQEAGSQFWAMLGLKPQRHRWDGYADFGVAEGAYSVDRARAHIAASGTAPGPTDATARPADYTYTTHPRLADTLRHVPPSTVAVLFFVPFSLPYQGTEDSVSRRYWTECKRRVVALARPYPNVRVVDFMLDSPVTRDPANYYDAIHYRPHIADLLARRLAQAAKHDGRTEEEDTMLLLPEPSPDPEPVGL